MGRWSSSEPVDIEKVRKGMMVKIGSKYCEVKEWGQSGTGRGAKSYGVIYEELDTGKEINNKFPASTRWTKIEPDRIDCTIMYLTGDKKEDKIVVLADEDFNEVELPLSRFYGKQDVSEGKKVVLSKDGEEIVRVQVR